MFSVGKDILTLFYTGYLTNGILLGGTKLISLDNLNQKSWEHQIWCSGYYYYWAAEQANLLPLAKVHLHIAQASFGPIATVAAVLLLFCLVTGRTQKAFQLPLSTWPVC